MIKSFLLELRPWQWSKNLLIFAGILFSGQLFISSLLLKVIAAFALFCLISSCGYMINDIKDRNEDRANPLKRNRPIASGALSPTFSAAFVALFMPVSLTAAFYLDNGFGLCALAYFVLTGVYTLALRNIVILDVLTVSAGFVIRAMAGAILIAVEISPWLLICTMTLALFLVLCKRRHETAIADSRSGPIRKPLAQYSVQLLDHLITIAASCAIITYMIYTLSERTIKLYGTSHLIYTSPIVIFAIFRYLYLVIRKQQGGSPEILILKDKGIMGGILVWSAAIVAIVYFI